MGEATARPPQPPQQRRRNDVARKLRPGNEFHFCPWQERAIIRNRGFTHSCRGLFMKLNLDDLKKLESASVNPRALAGKGTLEVIVKVKTPHYVPKQVRVRSHISDSIFTSEVESAQLHELEKDPQV